MFGFKAYKSNITSYKYINIPVENPDTKWFKDKNNLLKYHLNKAS